MSTDTSFDCPKCKRKGLVRLHSNSDIFECIYCRHTEDLGRPKGLNWLLAPVLAILVLLAVFGL